MNKIIITSACTLMLSLCSVFGVNQNAAGLGRVSNEFSYTTNVDENVTTTASNNDSLKSRIIGACTKAPIVTAQASTKNNTSTSVYAKEVLRLVNVERAKSGLPALTTNSSLSSAANKRAKETSKSFSHTRPNGAGFQTVLKEYGITYNYAGENIAYGQKTPKEVVTGWMNSPGHRANILNKNYHKIGIGVYQSSGKIYWTQEFTN